MLLLWLFAPILVALIFSLLVAPVSNNRNLIVCLPAAYLLLARAFTQLTSRRGVNASAVLAMVVLAVGDLIWGAGFYSKPHKEQFRQTVSFVVEKPEIASDAMLVGCAYNVDYFNYYFKKFGSSLRVEHKICSAEDLSRLTLRIVNQNPSHVFLIRGHKKLNAEVLEYFNLTFDLAEHRACEGADAWLFKRKNL
jgi:hypothetical protein